MKKLFAKITIVGDVIKRGKLSKIARPLTFFTEESPIECDAVSFKIVPKYWTVGSFVYAVYDPDSKFWSLHKLVSATEFTKAKASFDSYHTKYDEFL